MASCKAAFALSWRAIQAAWHDAESGCPHSFRPGVFFKQNGRKLLVLPQFYCGIYHGAVYLAGAMVWAKGLTMTRIIPSGLLVYGNSTSNSRWRRRHWRVVRCQDARIFAVARAKLILRQPFALQSCLMVRRSSDFIARCLPNAIVARDWNVQEGTPRLQKYTWLHWSLWAPKGFGFYATPSPASGFPWPADQEAVLYVACAR